MKTLHRIAILAVLAASLALLASCNFPRQPSPQEVAQTAAAQTVSAQLTLISLASPTVPATNTPVPEFPTSTPTPPPPTIPPPTATTGCSDSSKYVDDVTVPDNSNYAAGASFTKTWRLRNAGTCPWTTAFDVVFVDGNAMGGPASVPLAGPVPPGSTVDVSVNLTAPSTNGTHRGNYRLRNDKDVLFGEPFYVQIVVGPTPTPTVSVYRAGAVTLDNTFQMDLDTGTVVADATSDLWNEAVSPGVRQLTPRNGARLLEMGGTPSYTDCSTASLGTGAINFTDFGSGSWFCYKTSAGRFGRFEVEGLSSGSITIDFRTWN